MRPKRSRAIGKKSNRRPAILASSRSAKRDSTATAITLRSPFSRNFSIVIWRLARELDLPVVIHCRDCERDIAAQLERLHRPIRGILHSFAGNWEQAQAFLDLGLHLSFAGMITFKNKSLDSLSRSPRVPLDRLLVETDSPYLSPEPHRGRRNEPARVALVADRIAALREMTPAELARSTSETACAVSD